MYNGRLEGKVAFITGVAKTNSIGFATASVFGQEGAALAIADISDQTHECAEALRGLGYEVSSHTADLTKADQASRIVSEAQAHHGCLDILVNNAGLAIAGPSRPPYENLVDMDVAKWDFGIAINLKSQFLVMHSIVPHMIKRGYGRIVNVSSTTGAVMACKGQSEYCAAKAGVLGLTRGLALEVADQGILANAVAPGWVDTGGSSRRGLAAGIATPMGRAAKPVEIARVIAFLASEENTYLTGQLIVIDGGNGIDEYHGPEEFDC
jgi:3-oxoacyl-[acyl-carrier protein] reductase